jgi:hypothetical protein
MPQCDQGPKIRDLVNSIAGRDTELENPEFTQGTFAEGLKAMYDKILVAVDHSEISDRAVLAARDLAVLSKGEVKLTWADGGYAGKLVTWAKTRQQRAR